VKSGVEDFIVDMYLAFYQGFGWLDAGYKIINTQEHSKRVASMLKDSLFVVNFTTTPAVETGCGIPPMAR